MCTTVLEYFDLLPTKYLYLNTIYVAGALLINNLANLCKLSYFKIDIKNYINRIINHFLKYRFFNCNKYFANSYAINNTHYLISLRITDEEKEILE